MYNYIILHFPFILFTLSRHFRNSLSKHTLRKSMTLYLSICHFLSFDSFVLKVETEFSFCEIIAIEGGLGGIFIWRGNSANECTYENKYQTYQMTFNFGICRLIFESLSHLLSLSRSLSLSLSLSLSVCHKFTV